MLFLQPQHPQPPVRRTPIALADAGVSPAIERLQPLLHTAAELDLHDTAGWDQLCASARDAVALLVADGELPRHFAIRRNEPPVVVARTLAAAWSHATTAPRRRRHRV